MAEVAPFQGIKYAVSNLEDVVCPPYDVISSADRDYYHQKHPLNFVRLVLGEEYPSDSDDDDRFTRARGYLDRWIEQGAMSEDSEPAMYVYEQDYVVKGRRRVVRAFICLVKLARYEEGSVLPHENTLSKPKSELIRLIRETRANLDSIYGLYSDPEYALDGILERAVAQPAELEAKDKDGVVHRVWTVNSKPDIDAVTAHLATREIVIADGHHRYETALAYRDERRAQAPCPVDAPYDYVMMTIANVYGPDMTIFPTHRLVRNLGPAEEARLDSLDDLFKVTMVTKESLVESMAAQGKAIGLYRRGCAQVLVVREGICETLPYTSALQCLDLGVLHGLILERALGIDPEQLRQETNLVYTRDEGEAIRRVDDGEFQAAFLLNPIDVEVVLQVARAGERMPQKATYFYPKLLSGLVLRRIK